MHLAEWICVHSEHSDCESSLKKIKVEKQLFPGFYVTKGVQQELGAEMWHIGLQYRQIDVFADD